MYGRAQSIQVYLPSRTALVLVPKDLLPLLATGPHRAAQDIHS
jgi:hypothetical protein